VNVIGPVMSDCSCSRRFLENATLKGILIVVFWLVLRVSAKLDTDISF